MIILSLKCDIYVPKGEGSASKESRMEKKFVELGLSSSWEAPGGKKLLHLCLDGLRLVFIALWCSYYPKSPNLAHALF